MYGGITAAIVTRTVTHRPTVVTFHGSDLLGERLSGRVRNSLARLGVWASRRAARSASGIVVVSRGLRDALPTDVEHDMVRIIPCGIDLDRFRPLDRHACCARLGWDPDRFHVLFPANAGNRVKRPDLAEAAVRVAGGDGIPVELHYLRGVANIDVPTWVNASDVLLLTSLHEGSPTVVKEALACTVPVVSVDVGDVAERIADIEGCHLCDADPHHLARGLRAVHEAG
jgi:glycosyltransferase involved in cell wall biosynthesis